VAVETAYLPDAVCHNLIHEQFGGRSLYDILRMNYNIQPTRAEQQIAAIECPAAEAKLLGVRKGTPILFIHRTTYGRDGGPFETVELLYRSDKYVFQAELHAE
jgi:GntR family transcriptional regulator